MLQQEQASSGSSRTSLSLDPTKQSSRSQNEISDQQHDKAAMDVRDRDVGVVDDHRDGGDDDRNDEGDDSRRRKFQHWFVPLEIEARVYSIAQRKALPLLGAPPPIVPWDAIRDLPAARPSRA
jgi:hypothetical protein